MGNFQRNDRGAGRGFRGGDRDFGQKPSFRATCAKCGASCEVPFRPNGSKPVYCRDCFKKDGSSEQRFNKFDDRRERRPFDAPPQPRQERSAPSDDRVVGQLALLNSKLDQLIKLLTPAAPAAVQTKEVVAEKIEKPVKTAAKKKAARSKK
jgi:CxxC-x17-CxxC domain-containing protein